MKPSATPWGFLSFVLCASIVVGFLGAAGVARAQSDSPASSRKLSEAVLKLAGEVRALKAALQAERNLAAQRRLEEGRTVELLTRCEARLKACRETSTSFSATAMVGWGLAIGCGTAFAVDEFMEPRGAQP